MIWKKKWNGRDATFRVSTIFFFLYLAGCVPTPSENASIPPKVTDLHSFFIPQQANKTYLWHFFFSTKDSAYFITYAGWDYTKTQRGVLPISHLGITDTLRKDSLTDEAFISDSIVIMYYGKAADSLTQTLILLHDTLQIGASWSAADNFITVNGTPISIKAKVMEYYTQTPSANTTYNDVFLISYTTTVKGSQIPLEPQYQNGSHIDKYFARNIGEILEIAKDTSGSTLWTNELVETRNR